MTQAELTFEPTIKTLTDRIRTAFLAQPNTWIDARALLGLGGFGGWRTRISELRHAPYFMTIQNRTRRATVLDKGGVYAISESRPFTISEYRFTREDA